MATDQVLFGERGGRGRGGYRASKMVSQEEKRCEEGE